MDDKNEKQLTKFESFASRTGIISKFVDYKLDNIPTNRYAYIQTNIRMVLRGTDNMYFYRLEDFFSNEYSSQIAMIEYSDLVEINKALTILSSEFIKDKNLNPDYLENKFVSDDGFKIGYYISPDDTKWFVTLERISSKNLYFDNPDALILHFKNAQIKIEELKK